MESPPAQKFSSADDFFGKILGLCSPEAFGQGGAAERPNAEICRKESIGSASCRSYLLQVSFVMRLW